MDIDKEIAEKAAVKVLGWSDIYFDDRGDMYAHTPECGESGRTRIGCFNDMNIVWLIVEKMQERNLCIELAHYSGIGYRCGFWGGESTKTVEEKSAPLAICKAALAAIDTNHQN